MQHSATPLPTLLPTEIIEEVIDQASEDRYSLRRLSLLCKSLLTRARIHLFTAIVIRSVQEMESSSEFLDSHPWVPPLVQKVSLSINVPRDYSKPHIPLLDIIRSHLFTRLPKVHAWSMKTDTLWGHNTRLSLHRSTLLCYRTYGSRIRHLELARIRIQGVSHFARLVSAFTGLQSLTCSEIWLPTKNHTSQFIPNFKLGKALALRHLSVSLSVDLQLFEYLLGPNLATLDSLAVTLYYRQLGFDSFDDGESESCLERVEESLSQLSEISSFTVVIPGETSWGSSDDRNSLVEYIRQATRILKSIRTSSPPKTVQAQINTESLATLGYSLSCNVPALEACTALEESLLAFPAVHLQICCLGPYWRAGRPEFWSPTITSALPKLNERGLLALPRTHASDPSGHEDFVRHLVAFHDSRRFATASEDGTIIVWNAELGNIEQQWLAHGGPVYALQGGASPNSRHLVSAGGFRGESLVVWDISNGVSKVAALTSIDWKNLPKTCAIACAWSPDGTLIASGCRDGTIHVWDALTFQRRGLLLINDEPNLPIPIPMPQNPTSLQWSPDSRYLAWRCTRFQDLKCFDEWTIWSPLAEEPPKRFPSHPTHSTSFSVYGLCFDPRSRYMVTNFGNDGIVVNDRATRAEDASERSNRHLRYLQIRDVVTAALVADLEHTRGVVAVSFSPDGGSLLSVSGDGSVKIWEADSWHETASYKIDGREMERACFSPNGEYVAATALANDETSAYTVRLWRLGEASQCVAVFTEHRARITCLEFTPDGEYLASADESGIVHIHRLSSFIGH